MNWENPVIVRNKRGERRAIGNSKEALTFMEDDWPVEHTLLFARARKLCTANLTDDGNAYTAELAFRAAVLEIGLFPTGKPSNGGTTKGPAR